MLHLHRDNQRLKIGKELSLVRFFISLGLAGINSIWAIYMNYLGISDSAIGFISAFLVLVSFLVALLQAPILQRYGEKHLIYISILLSIISYLMIAVFNNVLVLISMAVMLTILGGIGINSFDIIFRDSIRDKELNREQGFMYMLMNAAWFIGPLIAGFFLLKYGYPFVFFVTACLMSIAIVLFLVLDVNPHKKKRDGINNGLIENLKEYVKRKDLILPYMMSAGIEVWWSLVYIYIPLFILRNGLTESAVSIFIAIVVIPLILLEYKVGELSIRYGFRPFLMIGFFGLMLLSFALFFIGNITLQLILVLIGSIFIALIEPLQLTHFFKKVKKDEEERFFPIFRTSSDAGSFIGRFSIAGLLMFLPDRFTYILVALLMAIFAFAATRISKNDK